METYPRDIFQPEAGGLGSGGGDTGLRPLDPESLVRKVVAVKDRTVFHPAPMEDGVSSVPDAKVWARLKATVRDAAWCYSLQRGFCKQREACVGWHSKRPIISESNDVLPLKPVLIVRGSWGNRSR